MAFPTAISFHRVPSSEALRAVILDRVRQLERLLDDILACRVVIEADTRRFGRHYGVHVRVATPCYEIEAGGPASPDLRHVDPYLTVAETFDALLQRLDEFAQRRCRTCPRHAGWEARAQSCGATAPPTCACDGSD